MSFPPTADCLFKVCPMNRYSAQKQYWKAKQTKQDKEKISDVVLLQKLQVCAQVCTVCVQVCVVCVHCVRAGVHCVCAPCARRVCAGVHCVCAGVRHVRALCVRRCVPCVRRCAPCVRRVCAGVHRMCVSTQGHCLPEPTGPVGSPVV